MFSARSSALKTNGLIQRCIYASGRLPSTSSTFVSPRTTQLGGLRQISTTTPRRARYLRFSPDPEKPFDIRRWDTGTKVVAGLIVLSGVYYVMHLEQVPETGRWRFMDISPKYEAQLAEKTRSSLLETFKGNLLPPNHPITVEVTRVVSRILESSNLGTVKGGDTSFTMPGSSDADGWSWDADAGTRTADAAPGTGVKEWMVLVVNDPKVVNAMASFGTIVVFTGILPICRDDQGVASVLGHEIGHVVARHPSEKYSSIKVLLGIGILLEALGLDVGIARLITTYLMELPNSRQQELEADKIGMQLMTKACFDPSSAPEFMKRLAMASEKKRFNKQSPDFFDTHPASHKRVQLLEELVPDAYVAQAANPECAGMHERLRAFLAARGDSGGGGGGEEEFASGEGQVSQRWT